MIIKFKTKTKEELSKTLSFLYYGTPFMIFVHSGMTALFGGDYFFNINSWDLAKISGLVVISQIIIYNRKKIFYWFKDWKKRNVKNGVWEI